MNLITFLKDKGIFLFAQSCIIVFIGLLLNVLNINMEASILIGSTVALITIGALAYEYIKRKHYYNRLYQTLDSMDKKQYIAAFLEEPDFTDASILCDILKQVTKAMNDEIAFYKLSQEEYREYIETWIHEVKIPISCIDLICKNNKNETTKKIADETDEIHQYIEQTLFYARSTNVEKDYLIRKIELDSLVKSVIKKHSRELIGCKTQLVFEHLDYIVHSDPKWLDFILGQLISNSVKYKKDRLKLSFKAEELPSKIILSVTDNGSGIPKKDLSKVFEKGFTGENGRTFVKSTGIGLYLCKRLCEKMHLGLEIESEEQISTTVKIIFPKDNLF